MSAWDFRKTTQPLAPAKQRAARLSHYDLYPAFPIGAGKIEIGYDALARRIARVPRLMLDGYGGVLWENFRAQLDAALQRIGIRAAWHNVEAALYAPETIEQLVAPFLGGNDPLFGYEFPIRFDYLDTFDGGNLSLQCHPRLDYIRQHFGERFTQDETYYILDCKPDARVYLGSQENVNPDTFRAALEQSAQTGATVDAISPRLELA